MDDTGLERRVAAMRAVAERAGRLTLTYFQHPALAVEHKPDASPVTEADRACETLIRRTLGAEFPHDGLLGEELGHVPGSSGWDWVIDPIDGTVSFAHGVPLYGVLIGLERVEGDARRVVAGTCELPAMRERVWAAQGRGAWWERDGEPAAPARVTAPKPLAQALVGTTGIEYFRRAGRVRGWSDCYALALAATGRCDAVVEPWMNPWDSGPFPVIFEEAGGAFSAWDGTPGIHGRTAVAAHPALHAELLTVIAEARRRAVS
jgi:histidinol phosphatase-like enzyme (inositol monophosphatase family)